MKVSFTVLCLLFLGLYTQAQTAKDPVSNIQVRYRTLGDENLPPPSVFDPAYNDRKVEMEITFTLANVDSTNTIEIKTGKADGAADILNATVTCFKVDGKNYFSYNGQNYEIKNNQVVFSGLIAESTLKKSSFLSLSTLDKKNVRSKSITKKLN